MTSPTSAVSSARSGTQICNLYTSDMDVVTHIINDCFALPYVVSYLAINMNKIIYGYVVTAVHQQKTSGMFA